MFEKLKYPDSVNRRGLINQTPTLDIASVSEYLSKVLI
jgi:hypothetical protein